jgi:hypothetical protein
VVLTGFNTDIEYSGTVYHVQTEDKGRANPLVESLVYTSGEILYSRRTPYHDLVAQNVESETIASLMERQHRNIVQAVQAGGVERLTETSDLIADADDTTITRRKEPTRRVEEPGEPSLDQVILDYLEAQRQRAHLVLRAAGEQHFFYGGQATITILAEDSIDHVPIEGVSVTAIFKSTAEPRRLVLAEGSTDESGRFTAEARLPPFGGGTSAVVITAESDLGRSEMKHLVHRRDPDQGRGSQSPNR